MRHQLPAAQEDHARGQPAALRDPAPDLRRIHRIQHLRGFGIGHRAAVGAEIPGGVKAEIGVRGHANLVVGNGAENDGAGRSTETVDDHRFAGGAQALIFVDIGADPAAAVVRDPNHGMACPDARDQQDRREQPRNELHDQPQSNLSNPNLTVSVMQDFASVLPRSVFCPDGRRVQIKFKSSVARGMHSGLPEVPDWSNRHPAAPRLPPVFAVDHG